MKLAKRVCAWCAALALVLTALPQLIPQTYAAGNTPVESKLDFTAMSKISEGSTNDQKAASKQKVKDKLLAAGAFAVENLFLVGNWETIVNPGGYNGVGYFIQKVDAAPGETIQSATLELGYWVANGSPQGYVQVFASADNQTYELVYEQREGNGEAFTTASRRTEFIDLPFVDGQTTIYVKVAMEHWNTYEGAGVAVSNVTINGAGGSGSDSGSGSDTPVDPNKPPEECTMVTQNNHFNSLPAGEVSAEDLGAVSELNMFFGIDGVTLLSPRNGYEIASATWMIQAAEGEPLHDCVLTFVGRTYAISQSVKEQNYLRIYASPDGKNFTQVKEYRSNDNPDDTQRFIVDLTDVIKGSNKAYVKMEWLVFDSPHIFGIRSVSITGNTAGIDTSGGGSGKPAVHNSQNFSDLPVGKVDKEALYAFKTANLMYGYNGTQLLTPVEAGEDAYVTWKLTCPTGDTFEDCRLVLVGKFSCINPEKKDRSEIRVHLSTDAENYAEVKVITPTEDTSDKQKIEIDLTAQSYGLSEIYVRVYWRSDDDPAAMGLRAMSLVANAGEDYALFVPEVSDSAPGQTETPAPEEAPQTPAQQPDNSWIGWVIGGAVAVVAAAAVIAVLVLKKKKASPGKADADKNEN